MNLTYDELASILIANGATVEKADTIIKEIRAKQRTKGA